MEDRPVLPFRFACRRSGNCCARPGGFVRIGPEDIPRIAAHLELSTDAFRSRYLTASGDRLVEGLGGRCVFLEEGRPAACGIYPVRPARCRSWPFWPELRDSREALDDAMRLCPGIEPRARAGSPARGSD